MVHIKRLDEMAMPNVTGGALNIDEIVRKYNLKYNESTGRYDCNGNVDVISAKDDLVANGRFVIPFGVVGGNFYCQHIRLESLEGAPTEVGDTFYCQYNRFSTLEGAPRKVGRDFICSYNYYLTSIKGAPTEVGGDFFCNHCKIESLEGAPEKVGGDFECILL